jgi:hypothetical protein
MFWNAFHLVVNSTEQFDDKIFRGHEQPPLLLSLNIQRKCPHDFCQLAPLVIYFCLALLIFFGLIIGLAVHEFGHGLMWVWFSKSKEMTIAINFSSVKVICSSRSPKEEIIISLFGPALNILIFVAIAIITLIFPWSFFTKLALLSFAIGAGVFCVSLLGGDGRLIRDRIMRIRMNEK